MGLRTAALFTALLAACASAQEGPDLGEKALDAAQAELRGFDYWLGRGVARDHELAARWLEQAANAGRPHAAAVLADLYSR
ncbi:MAG TPA: SEL1-like repeat protein, partial [Gammaproteobacteria bacterium]